MLITPGYKDGNRYVHANQPMWGASAPRWRDDVLACIKDLKTDTILDYGCGKGHLKLALSKYGMTCAEYDPGIPGKDAMPEPADLVAALDVMEHVEPECLSAVLSHIGLLARKGALLAIALYPSGTVMPDGRNAHLIVEEPEWWLARITNTWRFPMELVSDVVPRPSRNPRKKDVLVVRMKVL